MIRSAACGMIYDRDGLLMIVKPTYRDDWLLPGGTIEVNESPSQACAREIREELGVAMEPIALLCIEYQSQHDDKSESIQYTFDCGTMTEEKLSAIRIPPTELSEYAFVELAEAERRLNRLLWERLQFAIKARERGGTIYIEDKAEIGMHGHPPGTIAT